MTALETRNDSAWRPIERSPFSPPLSRALSEGGKKENLKTSPASDVQVLIVILLKKMIIIIVSIIMKHVRQIVKSLYSN